MKKFLKIIILLIFVSISAIQAQEVEFTASTQKTVRMGEQFRLVYTLNARGSDFKGPRFEGIQNLSGPNSSSSSNIQYINGKVTKSVSNTYTYYLRAIKEGEFTIPPAIIYNKKNKYESEALKVKVISNGTSSGQTQQRSSSKQQNVNNGQTQAPNNENEVFLKLTVDKSNPYLGEQIIVNYRLYTKIPISSISINKLSSFGGFWSKNLTDENQRLNQSTEYINGEEYVVAEIRKIALYPQKTGDLTIEPMELECIAQIRKQNASRLRSRSFFDNFFDDPFYNTNVYNVNKTLKSELLKVKVKPLPLKNKPSDFNGAVGDLLVSSKIDKTELKVNDAINFSITISGKGNIELIDELNVLFPPDFEAYDPKITNNIKTTNSGVSGSRKFEYLLIPRNPGQFVIEPVEFTYFDVSENKYKTNRTPKYIINVEKGSGSAGNISYSGVAQEDIRYIGTDIRHIKKLPVKLLKIDNYFFGSTTFYLLLIIPVILLVLIILMWKNLEKKHTNIALMKHKKATKVAKRNLKKAKSFLKEKNKKEFYIEISQALWGYLSDKFHIPRAELSMDSVSDALTKKNVKTETIEKFIATLNNCEFARFAPGDAASMMEGIYDEALEIISKIERELR